MKFSDIFAFPDDIVISLLVVWSRQCEVVSLDTACCNSLDRPLFLDILKHKSLSISSDLYYARNFKCKNERRRL